MKRLIPLLIISILLASCSIFINENKIVNIEGKRQKLDYSKHRIYVLFSTLGCHDCHKKLNEYFESNNFYNNDTIEIVGYIGVQNGDINSLLSRKSSLIYFNKYYPKIKKVYFSEESKNKEILLLDYKIQNFEVPSLLVVKNNTVNFIEIKDIFKFVDKRVFQVNEDLLILLK